MKNNLTSKFILPILGYSAFEIPGFINAYIGVDTNKNPKYVIIETEKGINLNLKRIKDNNSLFHVINLEKIIPYNGFYNDILKIYKGDYDKLSPLVINIIKRSGINPSNLDLIKLLNDSNNIGLKSFKSKLEEIFDMKVDNEHLLPKIYDGQEVRIIESAYARIALTSLFNKEMEQFEKDVNTEIKIVKSLTLPTST